MEATKTITFDDVQKTFAEAENGSDFCSISASSRLLKVLVSVPSETSEQIERRMAKSIEQMKTAYNYDYVVLNNDLEAAVQDVVHIICTVRRRTMLHKELIDQINNTFS